MSYILDALKKSEAERSGSNLDDKTSSKKQDGLGPSVLRDAVADSQGSNTAILIVLLLVFILIGLVSILLYTQSLKASPSGKEQVVIEDALNSMPLKTEVTKTNSSNTVTEARLVLPSSPATVDDDSVASAGVSPPSPNTPFAKLEQIPTLKITGHTYSTIKDKRQVVMNGEVWREGAVIIEDVKLQEITQGGIILDVAGWPVVIGRSQGWKAIKSGD